MVGMRKNSTEPDLDLLMETPGVQGVYEVGIDGFLLDSLDIGNADPEAVAAISAVSAVTSARIGPMMNLGELKWILLEYTQGKMIIAQCGNKIFVVVTDNHVLLGDIFLKFQHTQEQN